jgi:uncharacterized protein (DUF4213/DUF364 family)
MSVWEDLLGSLPEGGRVRSVLVGAHWTAVCSRGCGLASTVLDDRPHGEVKVGEVGRLTDQTARALADRALSECRLEASIGVAALNALIEVDENAVVEVNAGDLLLEKGRDRDVALVGHFPFIPALRQAARQLWVLELVPGGGEHPADQAPDLIPRADVVALTGTTLINHTLDGLLALCRPDALVMMLGASTPLSPVLFDHGISLLSGVRVADEAAVLRTVGQGATFRQIEGVRLVTMACQGRM